MKAIKFPKRLSFPLNYPVELVWMSHEDFVEEHGQENAVAWFEYTEDTKDGGIIYIDTSRTLVDILEDMDHELGHVLVEWREHWKQHWHERIKENVVP